MRRGVVVVKRRVFPALLCAIVLCEIPWRSPFRFVSPKYRFAVYRGPIRKPLAVVLCRADYSGDYRDRLGLQWTAEDGQGLPTNYE